MSWLSGWGKRIELTLDSFWVDEDLTDFPVMLCLSSGTGRNDADVTDIFDELSFYSEPNISDLSHEYTMDSILGSTVYDTCSSGSINGTITNSNVVEGKIGNALEFGYVGSSLRYVVFSEKVNDWISISFWMKRHNLSYVENMFMDTDNNAIIACQSSSNNNYLYIYHAGQYNSNLQIADTDWHHVVCIVESSSTLRFYLDGVAANSAVFWSDTYGVNYIGRNNTVSSQEVPYMDHIRFYNKQLTQTEISALYTEGNSTINNKKLMITTMDNVPCYVEIENWDWYNKEAYLWTKVPTVYSGSDTTLYLYYDSTQLDNDNYVGDTGDAAAQNVWDDNFVGVWHFNSPNVISAGSIMDSSRNVYHGTSSNMGLSNFVDAKIGKGIDIESDECIDLPTSAIITGANNRTLEVIVKYDSTGGAEESVIFMGNKSSQAGFGVSFQTDGNLRFLFYLDDEDIPYGAYFGDHHYLVYTYDGSVGRGYIDTICKTTNTATINTGTSYFQIGSLAGTYYLDGGIDEVRLSNIVRSDAWIKTTYYSNWNSFITFGAVEYEPQYYLNGFITELNSPVSRVVRLYRRDTGVLMDSDTSRISDGYYYVTTTYSGLHFVIAFDDDEGESYNALISDKLAPRGIV